VFITAGPIMKLCAGEGDNKHIVIRGELVQAHKWANINYYYYCVLVI